MPSWMMLLFTALLIASVVSMLLARSGRGFGFGPATAGKGFVEGTMTITSAASGAVDRNGERLCTVSGTIVGPDANAVEVYGRIVLASGAPEPFSGTDRPVVYKPGKAESTWRFGTLADSVG